MYNCVMDKAGRPDRAHCGNILPFLVVVVGVLTVFLGATTTSASLSESLSSLSDDSSRNDKTGITQQSEKMLLWLSQYITSV